MKTLLTACFLLVVFTTSAQQKRHYYNYKSQPVNHIQTANYFSLIWKEGSLWHKTAYFNTTGKMQLKGSYKDSSCKTPHGFFTTNYPSGTMESSGNYVNGKKEGRWMGYYADGFLKDSATYINGKLVGMQLKWHSNGFTSDSAVWNQDGSGIEISWFDNGQPSSAGRYAAGKKLTGKWHFFHKNGQRSAVEVYDSTGTLLSRQYYDEAGRALSDTTNRDQKASFPGGASSWSRFLSRNIHFQEQNKKTSRNSDIPGMNGSNGGFNRADEQQVTVVVGGIIDEEGNLQDIQIIVPNLPECNITALEVMRLSPKWNPAISHNRKVKYSIHQPITFFYNPNNWLYSK